MGDDLFDLLERTSVVELIAGRDWLFEGGNLYIENSHLVSILHHFEAEPPFDDPYIDHAEYLRALLGENVDQAVAHFRKKVTGSVPGSAEVLVGLLARLGRYDDAIQTSLEHLGGEAGDGCPSAIQLCQRAGDYQRLREVARKERDLLGFAAGLMHSSSEPSRSG